MDSVDDWDISALRDSSADSVAVISPMTRDYDDAPHLFIEVQPLETIKERIKGELNRYLDPNRASDRAAFEAMKVHLKISEPCRYSAERPTVGPQELQELSALFDRGEIKLMVFFVVARGYAPVLDQGVTNLSSSRCALNWTN